MTNKTKTEAKHTPGPWRVSECADEIYTNPTAWGVCLDDGRQIIKTRTLTERDARLIAAAPELLAALRAVKKHGTMPASEWGLIDAAIAKAEGR